MLLPVAKLENLPRMASMLRKQSQEWRRGTQFLSKLKPGSSLA